MINCGIRQSHDKHICLFLPHREVRAREGKSVPTASNAAYGVVSHDLQSGGGGGDVAMYEMVGQPPSATPTAHPPSDYLHPSSSQGPTDTQDLAYAAIANAYLDTDVYFIMLLGVM